MTPRVDNFEGLVEKIKDTRHQLQSWSKTTFRREDRKIHKLKDEIAKLKSWCVRLKCEESH